MKRIALAVLAIALSSCVSSQSASNGVFRFVNAIADSASLSLLVDEERRAAGFDYARSSSFLALRAGTYAVAFEELLPRVDTDDDGDVDVDDEENYQPVALPAPLQTIALDVNDELTYVFAGNHGSHEVIVVEGLTATVPTGQTRVQFVHAGVGSPAVDVYIAPEDTEAVTGLTPVESALAYLDAGTASLRPSGVVRLLVTAAGDDDVLFDSGNIGLSLEGSLLFTLAPNVNLDAAERPLVVILSSGSGATTIIDTRSDANYRFVNASSGDYSIDAFVTKIVTATESDTRIAACPVVGDENFVASYCALPYEYVGPFTAVDEPASYRIKTQIAGSSTLKVKNFIGTFARGGQSTLVFNERPPTDATVTDIELDTLATTRRIAPYGQLRIVTYSEGLDAAVSGDPTTDRVDLFITEETDDPLDETARFRFTSRRYGSDTGYVAMLPGDYRLTYAKVDTANDDDVPVPLYTADLLVEGGGVYTLLFNDTSVGVLPLRVLSLEDDTGLTPVP